MAMAAEKISAARGVMRPAGSGRVRVRCMRRVVLALDVLVERVRAGGDQRRAEEGVQQQRCRRPCRAAKR